MKEEDKILLHEIGVTRNLSPSSLKVYRNAMQNYTSYCGRSFTELLAEAEDEEEQGVRWKHRRVRTYLIGFRAYLLEKYEYKETIRRYFTIVQTIYRHYEIELQPLPRSSMNTKKSPQVMYDDLPTKDLIRKALTMSNQKLSSILLLICSSGMGRTEVANLTVQDFIDATGDYHNKTDIHDVLTTLSEKDYIIPTWHLRRQKTNKHYLTFSSNESTKQIISYLQSSNRNLKNDSSLFDIQAQSISLAFQSVNDALHLGRKGTHRLFRPHMLRKYHSSNLSQGENCLTESEIDFLQGRTNTKLHESYFLYDHEKLKQKYCLKVADLCVTNDVSVKEYSALKLEYDNLLENIDSYVESAFEEAMSKFYEQFE